ncbi:MAG TPA: NAD(P)-dependent oxidoreductase [Actinobacteria bacterium]|nr:NAD(P)-dependent oxidoreductase [Actinomycetota bacterium]
MTAVRIGVVGSGFISKHFVMSLDQHEGYDVSTVLTRRAMSSVHDFPRPDVLSNSLQSLLESSDVIVECSGDPIYATDVIDAAVTAQIPVVTMNTEFHVTSGSYFVGKGLITEAEGDQPGCEAALHEEALELGFTPVVYGNMKGFLNEDPTPKEMAFWGAKQGISVPMVTSFTDGTKVQFEQALVANHFGATIARPGLLGLPENDLRVGGRLLAEEADRLHRPISDYLLSGRLPHGVFIVARHDDRQKDALSYLKLGDGPYYVLVKNNIFVHLEILKTVKRVLRGGGVLLDNGQTPEISVAAVAKRDLAAGQRIAQGIGSFDVRGVCVRIVDNDGHVPIGLLKDAVVTRPVARGEVLTFGDVRLPASLAMRAWAETVCKILEP